MTQEQPASAAPEVAPSQAAAPPETATPGEPSSRRQLWRTVAVMLAALGAGLILSGGFWVVSHEDQPDGAGAAVTQSEGPVS